MDKAKITAAVLCSAMILAGCNAAEKDTETEDEDAVSFSRDSISDIRPQDDFYGSVNLETLKGLRIEYGKSEAGTIADIDMSEQTGDLIKEIAASNEKYGKGSPEDIIKRAYDEYIAFIDDGDSRLQASDSIRAVLSGIEEIKTLQELKEKASELKEKYGVDTFSFFGITPSSEDASKPSGQFDQTAMFAGADLKKISEYTENAKDFEGPLIDYLRAGGKDYDTAKAVAHDLMKLVIEIARNTDINILNSGDKLSYSVVMKRDDLDKELKNLTTDDFEEIAGIKSHKLDSWTVIDKDQLLAIDSIMTEENLEELKAVMTYSFVGRYGDLLAYDEEILKKYYPTDLLSVEDQACGYVSTLFNDELSVVYAKKYHSDKDEKAVRELFDELIESYRDLIRGADWLTEGTRKKLEQKLDGIILITGKDVIDGQKNDPATSDAIKGGVWQTVLNMNLAANKELNELIDKPIDRTEPKMPMHIMNACYSTDNTVNITVAIMNEPWFSPDQDKARNLGGLGSIVAHELGHAFDSNGILYDANGRYDPSWIDPSDLQKLKERDAKAVSYFEDNFRILNFYRIDGEKTLGENYADLGGMEAVMNACDDPEKKEAFESYARLWCTLRTDEDAINALEYDVHSPANLRVNMILSTLDDFYEIYDVKQGDSMYIEPEQRISRWR